MARQKTSQSTDTLAPTELHQQLARLQEERQWLLKQIRRKRTELDNFMQQMRELVTALFQQGASLFSQLRDTDVEIHALFEQILTRRKLGKRSHQKVRDVYESLQLQGIISCRSLTDDDGFSEFAAGYTDFPDDFSAPEMPSEPDPATADSPPPAPGTASAPSSDHRTFRQTFLRLAAIYHPDRADSEDAQRQNTEVMKEINRAYKSGDFALLLELERQQQQGDLAPDTVTAKDNLEQQCERLVQENNGLRQQYDGIKAELRELRNNTQEGMMVTTYRKAAKEGIDFIDELLGETEAELAYLEKIREFVRDFCDRKITLKEFLAGPQSDSPEDLMDILEQMFDLSVYMP
ncbi:Chaperone protein DnaJ [Halomicronema hongdechloris C2206]|uniref:Chaperone protein DnaJ n=1 Tax=Halomicronema hongdechloris C2206 TaxID=1641165 RepID=A0A1Z3HI51_9CYAN|nr:hypothetical protein [Halomicronema hongdechloris]ASC69807.1 Chaperone protein DnaJ [Halomicronema hongdechloris C2206]